MGELVVAKLILIFILCCSSMQHSHSLTGNATDRLALLAIKASMTDSNGALSSWNESVHFCLWDGVTCSKRYRQRVSVLNLGSLALKGSMSPYVGNLSFLKVLDLRNNSFTHHIPPQIGNLHRLQVLILGNNSLSGTIPANISNCFQLKRLVLDKNNLAGKIPSELSSLSKLQFINLQFNNLTGGILPSLGNLSSLEVLALSSNKLGGSLPSSLCLLKKLRTLFFGHNRLSGVIPPCIYNLSGIHKFEASANQFQGSLPSNLGNSFSNLQICYLYGNLFTGAIPLSISNASNLIEFDVGENNLTGQVPNLRKLRNLESFVIYFNHLGSSKNGDLGFVSELINATQLTRLDLNDNSFGGTLPTSIFNLSTNLQELWVSANQLRGSIPTGLGNLVNLQSLVMSENYFTGSIPTDIGKASRLGVLALLNNKLSGSIPSSLGNLSLLTTLFLARNKLSGTIPLRLGECHALLEMDISQNNLVGTIPHQLLSGLFVSLYLNFSQNHLSGSFPVEIGKRKNLGVLDASHNLLHGEVPSSLGACESLEVLYLQSNFFTGPIPSSMKELRGIEELDLSHNNLSGDVPKFLEGLRYLKSLNLSFNRLVGEVPTGGVFRNASEIEIVGNTGICGGIAELGLPVCKPTNSKRAGLSRKMKIVISLVSAFTLLGNAVILYFFFLRKKKKEVAANALGNSMLQVSYAALRKATDGFSPSNLIGTGAFASVYRGILEDDRVVVAVKVFNMLQRGASKSFMAECEALRNIRHRNLVKIITACSSIDFLGNDFKALVYDFMDNGSLEEWLHPSIRTEEVTEAPKVLTLVQRLDIAIDVAYALDYLHNNCETPIVHCDLKPSNVLLDREMTGHVSDFGLAKFLSMPTDDVSGNQSSSIGIRGTVGYASPEYGMGSEVSTNGDIYSFGILLLEMFTGKRPTEPMFSDGFNLHNFVKMALPERVLEIADALVLQEDIKNVAKASNQASVRGQKVEECLTLIFGIGIACSVESPTNRKDISEAAAELQSIRDNLFS